MTMTPSITQSAEPEPTLNALIFIESGDDAQFGTNPDTDILQYMFQQLGGSASWYGFQSNGTGGVNATGLQTYMDWPGFVTGTTNNTNGTIQVSVPQSGGGVDSFGNAISQYAFVTAEVPTNTVTGNIFYSIFVPHSLLNNSTKVYSEILVNYLGSPNSLSALGTDPTLRVIDVVYNGPNWPNTTYRVFSGGGGYNQGSPGVTDTNANYFKGGSLI